MHPSVFYAASIPNRQIVAVDLRKVDANVLERGEFDSERAIAKNFHARRRRTFFGGRFALRVALTSLGEKIGPISSTPRGAPLLPAGWVGSISHKDDFALAIAGHVSRGFVGCDIEERDRGLTQDISKFVLTPNEIVYIDSGAIGNRSRDEEILLRFSLKEALYKVLDPAFRRYVGFHEVSVWPHDSGTAEVNFHLKTGHPPQELRLEWATAQSQDAQRLYISTAFASYDTWHPLPGERPGP